MTTPQEHPIIAFYSKKELQHMLEHLDDETEWCTIDDFWKVWGPRVSDRIPRLLAQAMAATPISTADIERAAVAIADAFDEGCFDAAQMPPNGGEGAEQDRAQFRKIAVKAVLALMNASTEATALAVANLRFLNAMPTMAPDDPARPHIVGGEFQSDKYPSCPPGKVPLSVKDPDAQDLLWEYAQRHRARDPQFSDDLEHALRAAGFEPRTNDYHETLAKEYASGATHYSEGCSCISCCYFRKHPQIPRPR